MDEGVLLASTGRSEAVVLAPDALVERAAAAIEHSRLSTEERSLLVPARASISAGAAELDLAPEKPLAPGGYWLLASTRLKDAAGHHLQAAARFRETYGSVAYVGEGQSDRYGALYSDLVFANKDLVRICEQDGVPYRTWTTFDDVRETLESLDGVPGPVNPERCPGWRDPA